MHFKDRDLICSLHHKSHEIEACTPSKLKLCHYVSTGHCSITKKSSQPSSVRMVNLNRGMPDRSSEVRRRHALAGTEGHSHLVIWVNYKCCRPQGGKMSWTAVSVHTHTHKHTQECSPYALVHTAKHHIPGGPSWPKSPRP